MLVREKKRVFPVDDKGYAERFEDHPQPKEKSFSF